MQEPDPDTTVVELHRVRPGKMPVRTLVGDVWRMIDIDRVGTRLESDAELGVGDTLALAPHARVVVGDFDLTGGLRGRAHAFVAEEAFKSSPSREDVPRLIEELEDLEAQAEEPEDPAQTPSSLSTRYERAHATDFAIQNLTLEAALGLSEAFARKERAVCLFHSGESCCVAITQLGVRKIRVLMEALQRPINPHLVTEDTLETLLEAVYGSRGARA